MYEYFSRYCNESGINFDQLMVLGRPQNSTGQERFSMAILAIRASSYRNAVSLIHRYVSQDMWHDLWPNVPVWEVPITSITNGVHLPSWVNGDLAQLYDQYLDPDWRERNTEAKIFEQVKEIPAQEIWEAHRRRKRRMVTFVRERSVAAAMARKAPPAEIKRLQEAFDPEAFTIGFARRFATYKRATLILQDVDRLAKLLTNPKMPVQIIISGKAHPKDVPGKTLIRDIMQLSRDPRLDGRLVFVEDYGIQVARELVQAVDLWLNNPRRGEEASGTSGMKAAMNGVPNLSILDGWFDEAYEQSGGWAIGGREPYAEGQDELHARAIYSTLENEILPAYYNNREGGVPQEWMKRVKQSLAYISPAFSCQRMVEEYYSELYEPADRSFAAMAKDAYHGARERTRWSRQFEEAWPKVQFVSHGPDLGKGLVSGSKVQLEAAIELAGLTPDHVRVEAVIGRVGAGGQLDDTQVMNLPATGQRGSSVYTFAKEFIPHQTGRLGYSLRVAPNHYDDPLTRPAYALLKWAQ
jgi:glycogen phosphorylase